MKRTKIRKKGKAKISVIQRKLWELCKLITRLVWGNVCYTCGATGLSGSNWQTGHMWAKAALGAFMKYDLRILRPQCFHCNINLGGMGAVFYAKMLEEIGPEAMALLEKDRQIVLDGSDGRPKAYDFYVSLTQKYTETLKDLTMNSSFTLIK